LGFYDEACHTITSGGRAGRVFETLDVTCLLKGIDGYFYISNKDIIDVIFFTNFAIK